MDKVLLDTDILSEVMRAKNPALIERALTYEGAFGRLTISAITVMEVVKGFQKLKRADALQRFLSRLASTEVLDFNASVAEIAGRIYGDLERVGQPVGRADPMIAATALHHNLTLVTGNTQHYQRIQPLGYSLQLDNWR